VTYTNTGAQNGFTGASVRLCGSGELPPACTATTLTTVDGTYVVNGSGTVTFTPATGFSGTATVPPTYQITSPFTVANSSPSYSGTDSSIVSAQLIPTINPLVSPVAQPDNAIGPEGVAVAMVLTTNDSSASVAASSTYPIDVTTVRLCGLTETAPACTVTSAGSVVKSGQGVFTITNPATGEVTFTPCSASGVPDASCTGVWTGVADVDYIVTDTHGNSATSTYTVTINPLVLPTATNDTTTTPYNTAKTVSVAANDTDGTYALAPTSVLLCGPTETAPACTQTSVSNGTGTFTVNPGGTVTYTPAPGFSGPAAVTYSIADTHGNRVDALLSITVDAPTVTPRDSSADSVPASPVAPTCRTCVAPASSVTPDATPAPAPSAKPVSAVIPPPPPTPSSPDGPKAAPHQRALVVNPSSPAVIDPLANARPSSGERLLPMSARLWNGTSWVAVIDLPGVGTWRLRLGLVVFTPARGYIGTVRCHFKISDTAGRSAVNQIRVVIRPRSGDVPSAIIAGRAQTISVVH
jgi:CshA-type fibril repeat protein